MIFSKPTRLSRASFIIFLFDIFRPIFLQLQLKVKKFEFSQVLTFRVTFSVSVFAEFGQKNTWKGPCVI